MDEWSSLVSRTTHDDCVNTYDVICRDHEFSASPLYISTKTAIVTMNTELDIERMFWDIDVIDYHLMEEGVVKKQIKLQTMSTEKLADVISRSSDKRWTHQIITHVDGDGDQFRDVRKISCGLCKHDITLKNVHESGAFSNGLVLTIRMNIGNNKFHEIHVKVFNTGKLEVPGLKTDHIYETTLRLFSALYERTQGQPSEPLRYVSTTTVLVNSNFTCGYYIDRTRLYNILKVKYKLHTIFDPCSYPGVQSKFYYYASNAIHDGRCMSESKPDAVMSFMIFRTGSVLIVGKCEINVLYIIYEFIRTILVAEHPYICTHVDKPDTSAPTPSTKVTIMDAAAKRSPCTG